jgi:ATP-dependent exoDNAse (exonuclease V) alpha subunit
VSIYHLSFSSISRSHGRSACAASAYRWGRLGGPITDERLGVTFHYPKKRHVVFAGLVGWAGDNASLWNTAEATERRCNSVTAREVQVAIPRELSPEAQVALALTFATFLRETHGVAVDVAVHNPRARDGDSQPHAHLLMTTRRVAEDGSFGEKTRELDSLKTRSASVEVIRSSWAAMCNAALEVAGVSDRVDHRSYARQGVDKEAVHANRAAIALEERGIPTAAVAESNRAETRNSRRKARLSPTTNAATDAIATPEHQQGVRRGHR